MEKKDKTAESDQAESKENNSQNENKVERSEILKEARNLERSEIPNAVRDQPQRGTNHSEGPSFRGEESEKEIQGLRSQIIRLKAEFDNYRKRVEKEKELRFSYGKQTVLIKLIDLVEIFNNAVEHTKDSKNLKEVVKGLQLIHKEFMSFIMKEGIKPIETTGLKFNPDYHEIVGFKQGEDDEENIILQEVKPGYLCDDEVIRPAKVIVSKKEEETKESKP